MIYGEASKTYRLLIVENSPANIELFEREFRRTGINCNAKRIDSLESFVHALTEFKPDVILAENDHPTLDGLSILKISRKDHPEIPVIILADHLTESQLISLAHAGAKDYVLKSQLSKLPLAMLHVLTVEDRIRERKAAEQAIHESRELFRSISASAQDAIILLNNDGEIAFWNAAAERIFGYVASEVIGKDAHLLLAPSRFHKECKNGLSHFRDTGNGPVIGKTLELVALRKDGTEFPVELSVSALQLKGLWHAVGILRDISERKQYQDSLRQSLEKLAEAQHLAHIGSWSWDIPTDTIIWSEEYYRIYNHDPKLPTPNYVDHLKAYTAESAKRLDAAVKQAVEHGVSYALELELTKPDIAGKWILAKGMARVDQNGKVVGLYGTAQDITERKIAEQNQQKLTRALTLISNCNKTLIYSTNEASLLSEICRLTVEVGEYLMAWVGFPENDADKSVRVVASSGYEEGYLDNIKISWADNEFGKGPTGLALRTGNIQVNQNCLTNPLMAPWREAALKRGYQASIALPLVAEGEMLGVFTIYSKEPDAFTSEESELLSELSGDLAFGVHSLRILDERNQAIVERQHYADHLRNSLEETLQAIATTLEMRDPYTAGHQRRVADLASAIAKEMGLPEEQVHGIHLAAIVHDLGKIQIPAEILSRPGKLGEIAFDLVKTHSQVGYDILKDIEFPWPIAQTVLQHHERLDGSGYPQGLKNEEILLEAKILAVADTVEAMISHRPYRPGLGQEAALDEIRKNREVLYAPSVVDACLKLFIEQDFQFKLV